MSTKPLNAWDWDVRVRERHLRQGKLTEKDVEKHLASLPDVEGQSEALPLSQPALAGRDDGLGSL
jgi:hypothetical protein